MQDSETQITQRIKSTRDCDELLDFMASTKNTEIEPKQLTLALTRLFDLQKTSRKSPKQLIKHVGFNNICHLLKFKSPRMECNDLVTTLKVLSSMGLKSENLMMQRLLNLIKDQINELSPNNLIFLNFILSRMDKLPLIEALQIAIPVVFELNLSSKLDYENPKEQTELLRFICNSSIKLSSKSMTNIVTALTLHGDNLELDEAKSIIWSLLALETFDSSYEKLLFNCLRIINNRFSEMKYEDVESTLTRIIPKIHNLNSVFYNEEFLKNCAKFVIEKNCGFQSASFIQYRFNRIRFVSFDLLNYFEQTIVKNHAHLSTSNIAALLTIADGFSNANYKSENWEIMKSLIHENPLMNVDRPNIPWMRLAVNLMSLDFHSDILLSKIFNTKFLEVFLRNAFDYSQLLILWQAITLLIPNYKGPTLDQKFIDDAIISNTFKPNEKVLNILSFTFGGREFIQTNVLSNHGHCLDFVLTFDCNNNPVAMPCTVKNYDELSKTQVKSVAVFFYGEGYYAINYPQRLRGMFDLKRRTIEALGIKSLIISTKVLNDLPESEKQDYLEREIRQAL